MSLLAGVGVFVSAASLFVVLAGFNGLKDFSLGFISYTSPDLKVSANSGKSFFLSEKKFVEISGLSLFSGVSKSVEERVLISTNKNNQVVRLKGVDGLFPSSIVDSILVEGHWVNQEESVIVAGWGVANSLGLEVLDNINAPVLYAPRPGSGQVLSVDDAFASSAFITSGVFEINEESNNNLVYTSLSAAQELLGYAPSQISSLNFYLHSSVNEVLAVEEIKAVLGNSFLVKNRLAQNDTLYKMLNTEQAAVYLIFTLVVVIALFNVVGALIMMILEKRKDLAVLFSLGLVKKEIGQVFFYQGVLISVFGSLFGVFVGFCLVVLQQSFSLFMITPSLAYPVSVSAMTFVVVLLTVVVLGSLASKLASLQTLKSLENKF
ncbi:MAG TPA: FtsX-like permease family protein [Flavobacteriaceae bacterium]|nr:FtsX-like permease family protein [Flavobacteriaceae bacterium]|tara:strand:- start:3974 stop:5107 length:1134 start_codon:yes stop_codon:yes gene_type:complete